MIFVRKLDTELPGNMKKKLGGIGLNVKIRDFIGMLCGKLDAEFGGTVGWKSCQDNLSKRLGWETTISRLAWEVRGTGSTARLIDEKDLIVESSWP